MNAMKPNGHGNGAALELAAAEEDMRDKDFVRY